MKIPKDLLKRILTLDGKKIVWEGYPATWEGPKIKIPAQIIADEFIGISIKPIDLKKASVTLKNAGYLKSHETLPSDGCFETWDFQIFRKLQNKATIRAELTLLEERVNSWERGWSYQPRETIFGLPIGIPECPFAK